MQSILLGGMESNERCRWSGPLAESPESKRPSVRPGDHLLPLPIPSPLVSGRPESWDGDL